MNRKYWKKSESFNESYFLQMKEHVSDIAAKVLASRAYPREEDVSSFLHPSVAHLHDPFLFLDMAKAVAKIIEIGTAGKNILVYGDYDVDGMAACAMLTDFLDRLSYKVSYYIPDRQVHGYGLTEKSMQDVIAIKPALVITVDCGVTAFEPVEVLQEQGIEMIVTDHHELSKHAWPPCTAALITKRPDSEYPFADLCGAGIVLKLIEALARSLDVSDRYQEYLDLAALATVADVVPLVGENRVIVSLGLQRMMHTKNPGLYALLQSCDLHNKTVNSTHLGYLIAPRLNAVGRLGCARRAVDLLLSKDPKTCKKIAKELDRENSDRQKIQETMVHEAETLLTRQNNADRDRVFVIAKEGWHPGVIGIVSSKITEKYERPSILLSIEGERAKGSGRSVKGFHIHHALSHADQWLERYGGHEAAAGLSLKTVDIGALRNALNQYAEQTMDPEEWVPTLPVDAELSLQDMTVENIRDLSCLEPFGEANEQPTFLCRDLEIVSMRPVGQRKNHLHIGLKQKGFHIKAIGFDMQDMIEYLKVGTGMHVVCALSLNEWNGRTMPSVRLLDVKLADMDMMKRMFYDHFTKNIEFECFNGYNSKKELHDKIRYSYKIVTNRNQSRRFADRLIEAVAGLNVEQLSVLYRFIKMEKPVMVSNKSSRLSIDLKKKFQMSIDPIAMYIGLKILTEANTVIARRNKEAIRFAVNDALTEKVSIEQVPLFQKIVRLKAMDG